MSVRNLWMATLNLATTLPISAAKTVANPTPESAPAAPDAPALRLTASEIGKLSSLREFDFWIGDWEVFAADGGKIGENRVSVVNKGCTLAEHWTNSSGGEGRSYNAFDALTNRWYQFWTDDQGGTLSLVGGLQNGAMVLSGERPNVSDGKPQRQRITWTPNVDGSVRQLWETSDDAGASWQTSFDGAYRRKP